MQREEETKKKKYAWVSDKTGGRIVYTSQMMECVYHQKDWITRCRWSSNCSNSATKKPCQATAVSHLLWCCVHTSKWRTRARTICQMHALSNAHRQSPDSSSPTLSRSLHSKRLTSFWWSNSYGIQRIQTEQQQTQRTHKHSYRNTRKANDSISKEAQLPWAFTTTQSMASRSGLAFERAAERSDIGMLKNSRSLKTKAIHVLPFDILDYVFSIGNAFIRLDIGYWLIVWYFIFTFALSTQYGKEIRFDEEKIESTCCLCDLFDLST